MLPSLNAVHHIAIICSNYAVSKRFYTEVMGMSIIREVYREEHQSYKLDLPLPAPPLGGTSGSPFSFSPTIIYPDTLIA
ncbi:VOC family protein [Chitinophaga lutea]